MEAKSQLTGNCDERDECAETTSQGESLFEFLEVVHDVALVGVQ